MTPTEVPPEEGASPAPAVSGLRAVLANLGHLLGGKAAAGLMSLVYLAIVARTLGVERYGVLVLVNGYVLAVGSFVAFSGFHGVVRYGTLALEAGDPARLARIVRFMAVVEFGFGLLALLVTMAAVPFVGPRLGWSADAMRLAIPYSLAVFATVRATPQGILQIAGRFDLVGVQQIASPGVRLVGTLIVWAGGWGLDGFLWVWLLSSLAEGAAMWLLAWPSWRRIAAGEPVLGPWRGVPRDVEGFGRFILVTNFDITLRELAPNLAPLTIGWVLGPAAAGLFALAQKTTALLQQPAILIGQASYAVLAEQVAKRRLDMLRATVWRSVALSLAIGALFVLALAIVGDPLMRLLGGRTFAGGTVIVTLLAVARALGLAASPLTAALTALGRPQRSLGVTLMTNLLLYPLLPLLIVWQGLDGSGWHALAQSLVATALLAAFFRSDSRDQRGGAVLPRTTSSWPIVRRKRGSEGCPR